jgi:hypothetical protein
MSATTRGATDGHLYAVRNPDRRHFGTTAPCGGVTIDWLLRFGERQRRRAALRGLERDAAKGDDLAQCVLHAYADYRRSK